MKKRKRFLIKEVENAWELYWTNETGVPEQGPCAIVYDLNTLELLVSAPALRQMADINKKIGENAALQMRKREYSAGIFGKIQVALGHFLKKL